MAAIARFRGALWHADEIRAKCNKMTPAQRKHAERAGLSLIHTPRIYFVTGVCFKQRTGFDDNRAVREYTIDTKRYGWFHTKEHAVAKLSDGLVEAKFDYIVIEEIPPGIYATATAEFWFKWTMKSVGPATGYIWKPVKRPKAASGIINFGI